MREKIQLNYRFHVIIATKQRIPYKERSHGVVCIHVYANIKKILWHDCKDYIHMIYNIYTVSVIVYIHNTSTDQVRVGITEFTYVRLYTCTKSETAHRMLHTVARSLDLPDPFPITLYMSSAEDTQSQRGRPCCRSDELVQIYKQLLAKGSNQVFIHERNAICIASIFRL
jgi:hypothetical protein